MNIVPGETAAGAFKQAFKTPASEILVFNDLLSCGPLRAFTNIEAWKSYRQGFWGNVANNNSLEKDAFSFAAFHRNFYEEFEELRHANEFKLWIGTGLNEQLLLVFLISLLDLYRLDLNKLHIFQFERIPGVNAEAQALGFLSPDQIIKHPHPYTPTEEQIALAKSAWRAVVADSPDEHLRIIADKNNSMPWLTRAMACLVFRYPKSSNGLSCWDETLLKYTQEYGPNTAKIIGYTLADCPDELDLVNDSYLFSRLKNMARPHLNAPLVEANALDLSLRDTQIRILPHGMEVFRGKMNAISLNGIDDWVGGVHLDSSTGGVWLRKNDTLFYQKL